MREGAARPVDLLEQALRDGDVEAPEVGVERLGLVARHGPHGDAWQRFVRTNRRGRWLGRSAGEGERRRGPSRCRDSRNVIGRPCPFDD